MSTPFDAYSFYFYRSTSTVERNQSTQQNLSHDPITAAMPYSTKSATPTQVKSVTSGDKSTTNYSSLGPAYAMIDSRRSDSRSRNQVLLSERYEFADIHGHVESSGGVSTEGNVSPGQLVERCHEDYARLQH